MHGGPGRRRRTTLGLRTHASSDQLALPPSHSAPPRDWTIYSVEYVLFTLAASSAYLRLRPTIIHSLADTNAPTPTVLYSLSFLSSPLDYYWYSLDYRSIINHDDDSNP